jgi:hypothetical protein
MRFDYFYYDPSLGYRYSKEELNENLKRREDLRLLDIHLGRSRSDYFRKKFEAGEEEAMFDYVKESSFSFQSPWVTDQIEEWRWEDTKESRSKLRRVFKAYIGDGRGRTEYGDLKDVIRKDQTIFREIVRLGEKFPRVPLFQSRKQTILDMVQDELEKQNIYCSMETIQLVYKEYKKVADVYFEGDPEGLISYLKSTSLDDILERSRALSLSLDYRCSYCQGKVVLKKDRKSNR